MICKMIDEGARKGGVKLKEMQNEKKIKEKNDGKILSERYFRSEKVSDEKVTYRL